MPCRQPTTKPSAPCGWPSSPGASASEPEPRKAAPPMLPPCPLSRPADGAASIPGHTSPTLSPAPEPTGTTSRFLSPVERDAGERLPNLAERNLLRGQMLGLPSGQAVAHIMDIEPIPDSDLKVGKAIVDQLENKGNSLVDISPRFAGNAPLWY